MKTYVLLLRGINVGGHKRLLMNDLKLMLAKLGFLNSTTYIQSGNVVFQFCNLDSISDLENKVAKKIYETFGFEVPVVIVSKSAMQRIVDSNPFVASNPIENLHCTFFKNKPHDIILTALNQEDFGEDECFITSNSAYIKCNLKYSKSKLTNGFLEKQIGVGCTTRNWKTTLKLLELCKNMMNK
ncbi:MAG: DUF1697 domain-containing protein [Crocinitomicaceae bacterium]